MGLAVAAVAHDGKSHKGILEKYPYIDDNQDVWHCGKLTVCDYKSEVDSLTKCKKGDSKSTRQAKMERHQRLKSLAGGIGFHHARCARNCGGNSDLLGLLWNNYILHLPSDHTYCFCDGKGISSMGEAPCQGLPAKITLDDGIFLRQFFNSNTVWKRLVSCRHALETSTVESMWNIAGIY